MRIGCEINNSAIPMASIVKQSKRKAGMVLKSKTSGVIQGAWMVDVVRKNYGGRSALFCASPKQAAKSTGLSEGYTAFIHCINPDTKITIKSP